MQLPADRVVHVWCVDGEPAEEGEERAALVRLQREFLQALQQAVAKAEPARLLMLLRIGGALFGESDAARNDGVGVLLALATVDPSYEPLLSAWRSLLAPGAHEMIEKAATTLAPLGAE